MSACWTTSASVAPAVGTSPARTASRTRIHEGSLQMSDYLLIESRDPFESAAVGGFLDLAEGLAKDGSKVTLFLVQNAVMAARHGAQSNFPNNMHVKSLAALAANGVKV